MAKDPAVLWYYRDYLEGTELMSWSEQGAYARLLNKQADKGPLSIDLIKKMLKKDFEKLWPGIASKFLINDEGNYYNERMGLEVAKRAKNSQAQKERIERYWNDKRNNHGNTTEYTTVIPIENANAITNETGFKKGGAGETRQPIVQGMRDLWQVAKPDYPFDQREDLHALLDIGKFLAGLLKIPWLPEEDEGYRLLLETWKVLANWVVSDDFYKGFALGNISKTKTLQTIWQKSKEVKNATTTGKNNAGSGKSSGAEELARRLAGKLAARGAGNPGG